MQAGFSYCSWSLQFTFRESFCRMVSLSLVFPRQTIVYYVSVLMLSSLVVIHAGVFDPVHTALPLLINLLYTAKCVLG